MATSGRAGTAKGAEPWYSDGNVRSRLVNWLRDHGYFQTDDAATHDAGPDLIVRNVYDATSRISVRGFPDGGGQDGARQWFAGALLDLALHRGDEADTHLALALPAGFATYTTLAAGIAWLHDAMPFTIYWVAESGEVHTE